ncbi:MAG: hypothetical protein LBH15_06995, partial [Treponema sp.]|nr:hypothetical protein [Treponema sp.]
MRTKKNYFCYITVHFLFFLLLAALTFFILRPLQQTLRERMVSLRDYIISQAEGFFGLEIEYASIGPSLFGFFDIKDVRIWEDSDDPLFSRYPLISISRFRVSYSIFAVLRGDIPASVKGIYLDRPLITMDARNLEKYRNIAARLQGREKDAAAGEAGDWAALLPGDITVRVRRGECTIRLGESSASLRGLNFDTRIADERIELRGKWIAGLSLNYLFGENFAIAMAGRVSGEYDLAGRRGNVTLNIPSATGEYFNVRAVNFSVHLDDERLAVEKMPDRSSYSLSLDYAFASGRVAGEFRADNFSPREIVVLSGPRQDYDQYLALTATGSASFEADGEGGIGYRVDLSGSLGHFFPGLSGYAVNGSGNEKQVHFNELSLGFTRGSLSYSGDLAYSPLEPNGVLTVSDFSVSGDSPLNGTLEVSGSGNRIDVYSDSFSLGGVFLPALDLEFIRGEEGLSFAVSALRFRDIESWENVSLSEISLEGTLNYSPLELQTSLGLDSFSVMDILELARPFGNIPGFPAPVSAAIDDTSISTEIFITTDFSQISYNVPRLVIAYQGKRELLALVSLSGTDRRFEISEGSILWPGGGSNITGSADFSNIDDVSFSIRASWQEQMYYLEGIFLDRSSLSVNGS